MSNSNVDTESTKSALILTMKSMSLRVKQIREMVVIKKDKLRDVISKVTGDWKQSKDAGLISYLQTKIITSKSAIDNLMDTIMFITQRKE